LVSMGVSWLDDSLLLPVSEPLPDPEDSCWERNKTNLRTIPFLTYIDSKGLLSFYSLMTPTWQWCFVFKEWILIWGFWLCHQDWFGGAKMQGKTGGGSWGFGMKWQLHLTSLGEPTANFEGETLVQQQIYFVTSFMMSSSIALL
jgi:hypothetical protein